MSSTSNAELKYGATVIIVIGNYFSFPHTIRLHSYSASSPFHLHSLSLLADMTLSTPLEFPIRCRGILFDMVSMHSFFRKKNKVVCFFCTY